jgi:hypothetical protein
MAVESRKSASPRQRRRGAARKDGPNLPVPQHAREAHGCRLLPHGSLGPNSRRQADAGCASRPIRIGCKLIGCVREAGCSTQSRITGGTTSFPAGVASFQRSHRISSERSCICLRRWQRRLSVGRQRRSEVLLISAPFSVELPFLRVIRRRRKIPPARDEGPRGISRGCDFHHGGSTTF